jgi:hypothetical protein
LHADGVPRQRIFPETPQGCKLPLNFVSHFWGAVHILPVLHSENLAERLDHQCVSNVFILTQCCTQATLPAWRYSINSFVLNDMKFGFCPALYLYRVPSFGLEIGVRF